MREHIQVTPEMTAATVPPPDFVSSAQSVDELFLAVRPADAPAEATAMRLVTFKPDGAIERVAFVFAGPEASMLAAYFTQFADALTAHVAQQRQKATTLVVPGVNRA